ncbi:MAG: preprotein translocase subunit SecE [Candidatus Andersenbacteria bacterium]
MATKGVSSITNIPVSLLRFFREARDELRKVSWPSRETTIRYTLIVILSSLILGLLIGGLDYLLTLIIESVI